ncbi:UDP-galactopyranose mutase [Sphingomonas astaxanthinifaciens]|uniref:UDP-galactopyranose mutase n=1 Tax=Sphingomonas astaxanthinifaciens DSM 22298 TaxID=1123267 RepID=A0ABQ5Z8I8_9SPHN|nr:UDP-galactopyranose mutase [Sphingomonas astaxanthinifaciens]GLR48242.1 UDP-galactopyranose mutase [Sphingomonas astaxanthinifaciens DSM 22298]
MFEKVGVHDQGHPNAPSSSNKPTTLLCFSHLRWDFVFQRPQHLMCRFAKDMPVTVWEEPVPAAAGEGPSLDIRAAKDCEGVTIVTPHLPEGLEVDAQRTVLKGLLDNYAATLEGRLIRWYYTPMMLPFSRHLDSVATVYDCMDELSAFRFAPAELLDLERELLDAADVVFTGGYSLYEAKKKRHGNVHPFPSSVDRAHFGAARAGIADPADQAGIARPRFGFYGVIDERLDIELLDKVAEARPDWQLIMVGPVVKISHDDLPKRPNIHYLGGKTYDELPAYLGNWDVAMMPFAINDATRFISPTKTPEYLAAAKPVVSTPIRDVKRHYEKLSGVMIAGTAEQFVEACERALSLTRGDNEWLAEVDLALADMSWDTTQARMAALLAEVTEQGQKIERPAFGQGHYTHSRNRKYDYLVVGCGFAGSVLAERLASQHGARVLMIDKRDHVGGNAYDEYDKNGILYHKYGPHIFHANSDEIVSYLSQFTQWRPYEHRVLASVRDQLVPIPINRTTLNKLFDANLTTDEEAAAFLAARAEPVADIRTSEDVVVNAVGRELYELFFQGYTRKQWGLDPSELDKLVTARIPTRTNTDDRYFTDTHQIMPLEGYTRMFERMLDHPLIDKSLGTDFREVRNDIDAAHIIYTGPIDEYFDWKFGKLPYRSLRFVHSTIDKEWFQEVGTVNYPSTDIPYTRISEYKHLTGQEHPQTSITLEYPSAEGDPYYPIPRPENQALFKRYEALADSTPGVTFVGRLATYRYYNMDQIVGQALATFRRMDEARARIGASSQELRLAI